MENRSTRLMIFFVFALVWCFLFTVDPSFLSGKVLSLFLWGISLLMVYRAFIVKNIALFVVYIFMSTYAYIPINYFFRGYHISAYRQCESIATIYETSLIVCLFFIVLFVFSEMKQSTIWSHVFKTKKNFTIYVICIISIILITVFALTGSSIFEAGGYSESLASRESSYLNEYAIIFIVIAYVTSENDKQIRLLIVISLLYCVKNLMFGGRIQTLMVCLFFILAKYQYMYSFKKILIALAIGYLFLDVVGHLRANPDSLFESFKSTTVHLDYIPSNQGNVFYASMRIVYMINNEILSLETRLVSFGYFILSIVVPYSQLPAEANLSSYLSGIWGTGGGGLAPAYFYAFLSYPGVILLGFLIAKICNIVSKVYVNPMHYLYSVLVILTVPRWFAYYPVQLIKLCFIGCVLYWMLDLFLSKKNNYA